MSVTLKRLACTRKSGKTQAWAARGSRVPMVKESIVATLNVVAPGDAGTLWEALKASQLIDTALGTIMHQLGVHADKFCQLWRT